MWTLRLFAFGHTYTHALFFTLFLPLRLSVRSTLRESLLPRFPLSPLWHRPLRGIIDLQRISRYFYNRERRENEERNKVGVGVD